MTKVRIGDTVQYRLLNGCWRPAKVLETYPNGVLALRVFTLPGFDNQIEEKHNAEVWAGIGVLFVAKAEPDVSNPERPETGRGWRAVK